MNTVTEILSACAFASLVSTKIKLSTFRCEDFSVAWHPIGWLAFTAFSGDCSLSQFVLPISRIQAPGAEGTQADF